MELQDSKVEKPAAVPYVRCCCSSSVLAKLALHASSELRCLVCGGEPSRSRGMESEEQAPVGKVVVAGGVLI